MLTILTTKGELPLDQLDEQTIFTVRDLEWVIAVEYRLKDNSQEMVRRDCHVVLKHPGVAAAAIAGGL